MFQHVFHAIRNALSVQHQYAAQSQLNARTLNLAQHAHHARGAQNLLSDARRSPTIVLRMFHFCLTLISMAKADSVMQMHLAHI